MIPVEELARLAALYDRFANHLDPLTDDWKRRKQEFLQALREMHGRLGAGIAFEEFRREAQRACFRWIRAHDKPTPPRQRHDSWPEARKSQETWNAACKTHEEMFDYFAFLG